MYPIKLKDPEAVLDYLFRWGPDPRTTAPPWLEDDEQIVSHEVTVPAGINKESSEITVDGKSVLVWLSGGTAGITYPVECHITTTVSRTDVRRMDIQCRLK